MIPNAFYEVKYQYDRNAKRWYARFMSTELENVSLVAPLRDGVIEIEGENVVCEVEEDLALMFMQFVDSVAQLRAESAKPAEQTPDSPALSVPETE